jgi:TetR/AcrR family transcriptional repressor of nem operon
MPSPTAERIVRTAAQLFWENGFHATGIKAVLEAAEATSGSLYFAFPGGKEALLHSVLDAYLEELDRAILGPAFARTADPVERVFAVLEVYREILGAFGCARGCPVGNLATEVSDRDPGARRRIARIFDRWAGAIADCLEEARDRLPPDADPAALGRFVLTVMEGAVMQAKATRDLAPFDLSVQELRRYFELLEEARRRDPPTSASPPATGPKGPDHELKEIDR